MREIRAEYNREGKRASIRAVRALTQIAERPERLLPSWRRELYALNRALGLNNIIAHRIAHQLTHRVAIQPLHDIGAMRLRSLDAEPQSYRHFLAALTFG